MNANSLHISESIEVLNENLIDVAQVREWADLMGYGSTKKFSRRFLHYFSVRPCKILVHIRLKSIYGQLRGGQLSNFEIACCHSMTDEKALNKYVNYHLGCSPRKLKTMPEKQFIRLLKSK